MINLQKLRADIEVAASKNDRKALASLEEKARSLAGADPSSALIDCLVILSTGWNHCGDPARGRAIASFALHFARTLGAANSIRNALNAIAGAADAEGQVGLALRALTEAYRIAETIVDKPAMIKSLINIGTCCGRAGLLIHSQRCYETAGALVDDARSGLSELDYFASKCVLLVASTDSALSTGDLRRALQLAQRLRALRDELPKSVETFDAYQTGVFIEQGILFELIAVSRLGMLVEANEIGQEIAQKVSANSLFSVNGGSAHWALANLHRANGEIAAAIDVLRGLVDDPLIHREVRADLAACLRRNGQDEEAVQVWRKLQQETAALRREIAMEELQLIDGIGPNEDVLFDRSVGMMVALAESETAVSARLTAKVRFLTQIAMSAELPELHEHVERHVEKVGYLAARLAAAVGCDAKVQWAAEIAGYLHDVGKCAIPEGLRMKAEDFPEEEFELLRERANLGARLIEASGEPDLMPVANAIRNLHEHYDGSGYPAFRRGEEIPLLARVVSICESFVVMTEARQGRGALSLEAALGEISKQSGRQFDPALCSALSLLTTENSVLRHKRSASA